MRHAEARVMANQGSRQSFGLYHHHANSATSETERSHWGDSLDASYIIGFESLQPSKPPYLLHAPNPDKDTDSESTFIFADGQKNSGWLCKSMHCLIVPDLR